MDLQKKCESAEISSKALDLRGLLDANYFGSEPMCLRNSMTSALAACIVQKPQDYEDLPFAKKRR